jgi:hypothetical protein
MKALRSAALSIILLSGILSGQVWSDWTSTSTNPELQYRSQAVPNMRHCYLEFRDTKQGKGNTTFDVAVDYTSSALNENGAPIVKTDTEHIVTTPTHVGTARIPECLAVSVVRASVVQRL